MATAIALLGFNDLGRSVTPTILFKNKFYLQLSPHCPEMNKKINVGSLRNFKVSVLGTWNSAILQLQQNVVYFFITNVVWMIQTMLASRGDTYINVCRNVCEQQ